MSLTETMPNNCQFLLEKKTYFSHRGHRTHDSTIPPFFSRTFADSACRSGDPSLQSGAILSALQAMQSLLLVESNSKLIGFLMGWCPRGGGVPGEP